MYKGDIDFKTIMSNMGPSKRQCQRCQYIARSKSALVNHLLRSNPCTPYDGCAEEDMNIDELLTQLGVPLSKKERMFKCPHECGAVYKHHPNLSAHLKICKKKDGGGGVNNQTLTLTRHAYMDDTVRSFGNEDLNHLTPDFKTKCLLDLYEGIVKLCRKIYFDSQKPENKTVRFKNWKHNLFEIFTKDQWNPMNQNTVLNNMIRNANGILANHYFTLMNDPEFVERQETLMRFQNDILHGIQGGRASQGYCNMRHDVRILVVSQTTKE